MKTLYTPNRALRYQRERRNWTQEQAAEALLALRGPGKRGEVNARMFSKWERGVQIPSLEYRKLLCQLYEVRSPEDLGFLKPEDSALSTSIRPSLSPTHSFTLAHSYSESQEEVWLTYGTQSLAQLFHDGWSANDILASVRIVLHAMSGMSGVTRQQFVVSDVNTSKKPLLHGRHVSEEGLTHLHTALEESIGASWKLFHTASTAQLLALGQTQLSLLQQVHPLLHPSVRPYFYAGLYGLIGISLHFQERDTEALSIHQNGYFAASTTGNTWYIVQSLICQADCYTALRQYDLAVQTIEEALARVRNPADKAETCAKAHLLSCWADNAMMIEDYRTAQEKLEAAEECLDQTISNEEFDHASWLVLAGKYALRRRDYTTALRHFEASLVKLPVHSTLRRVVTTLGVTKAYARIRAREKSLEIAEQLVPMIQSINSRMTNRWFAEYLQCDLLDIFPTDKDVQTFVTRTYEMLPQLTSL